jgi:hypothetical protein
MDTHPNASSILSRKSATPDTSSTTAILTEQTETISMHPGQREIRLHLPKEHMPSEDLAHLIFVHVLVDDGILPGYLYRHIGFAAAHTHATGRG